MTSHNAWLVAYELNIGIKVQRGKDGSFQRELFCKAMRMVMGEERKGIRAKANEIGQIFKNKILKEGRYQDE